MNGNSIENGKVAIPDRTILENDSLIDKQYADDGDTYATDFSDPTTGLNGGRPLTTFGGIDPSVNVHGLTHSQLWDLALYPPTPPTYTQPAISLSATYANASGLISGNIEVGDELTVNLSVTTTLNDSQGLNGTNPYRFSGSGIDTAQDVSESTFETMVAAIESMSWTSIVAFQGAAIKNNLQGTPDATGQFGAVSKTASTSKNAYWPYWSVVIDGSVEIPTTAEELRSLTKTVAARPSSLSLNIPGDSSTKTILIAVPASTASISAIKDGAQPISSAAWTEQTISDVPAIGSSGQTHDYVVFRHDNGVGFNNISTYDITLSY